MRVAGNTFVITGGASGLGAACAKRFAEAGANVVLLDIGDHGAQTALAIGERARFVKTDVTDESHVQAALDVALGEFGNVHGAINCAGIATAQRIVGKTGPLPLGDFAKVISVNLIGTFNVLRLTAAVMMQRESAPGEDRGVIVNTASVAAFDGQIGQAAYAASKGGVAALTLPAAREFAQHAIRVMTIAPGIFDTPMLAGLPEPARMSLGQQTPFPARLGNPQEYAMLAQHIVENQMLNGEVIRLDGAIRLAPK